MSLALMGGAPSVHAQAYLNFQCADGAKLSLIFEKQGTALVMIDGGALRLRNRNLASGLWFASPHGDFRTAAGKARFKMTGRAPTTCVEAGKRR
jgi:hypothetical protein